MHAWHALSVCPSVHLIVPPPSPPLKTVTTNNVKFFELHPLYLECMEDDLVTRRDKGFLTRNYCSCRTFNSKLGFTSISVNFDTVLLKLGSYLLRQSFYER